MAVGEVVLIDRHNRVCTPDFYALLTLTHTQKCTCDGIRVAPGTVMKAAVSSHSLAACLSRIKARDGSETGTVMLSKRTINSPLQRDVIAMLHNK